ncbi:MAG: hypothetical protein QOK08_2721, partial [Actinomycetota bacterium]|nr:hypothetical protein [Actinomycetota bacterium]
TGFGLSAGLRVTVRGFWIGLESVAVLSGASAALSEVGLEAGGRRTGVFRAGVPPDVVDDLTLAAPDVRFTGAFEVLGLRGAEGASGSGSTHPTYQAGAVRTPVIPA